MPAALVKSLSESTGIPIDEAEKRWEKAKKITQEERNLSESDGEIFWKYVVGVFKRSMGVMEDGISAQNNIYAETLRRRIRDCRTIEDIGETILIFTGNAAMSGPYRTIHWLKNKIDDPNRPAIERLNDFDWMEELLQGNPRLKETLPDHYSETIESTLIPSALAEIKARGKASRERIQKKIAKYCREYKRILSDAQDKAKDVSNAANAFAECAQKRQQLEDRTFRSILTELADQSPVTKREADLWVKQYVRIDAKVTKCLNSSRHFSVKDLNEFLALFYRACGGKVPAVTFHLSGSDTRSFCLPKLNIITLARNPKAVTELTIFHEMGHLLESNPMYLRLSLGWLNSRIKHPPTKVKLRDLTGEKHYGESGEAFVDGFWDPYVAKDYGGSHTEVFSMGMQRLAALNWIQHEVEKDTDHWDFILGVLSLPITDRQRGYLGRERIRFENAER